MLNELIESSISFTENYSCPYFKDGRKASTEYLVTCKCNEKEFHTFLSKGYRRLGRIFYRNVCVSCHDCKPLRVNVEHFRASASHKRTVKKNVDVYIDVVQNPVISMGKLALYNKYLCTKHDDDNEDTAESDSALHSMHYGYSHIIEMDYYLGKNLIGVGIVDEGKDCLSSNYFYYDTDCLDRRPGVFSILQEIGLAKTMGKQYYYLGFYIEDNTKMSYKKDFRPNQIFENGEWTDFLKG